MLDTFSPNPATEHVLQLKVADFQHVLGFDTVPLSAPWLSKLLHFSRRFPLAHDLARRIVGKRRSGLFVTFNIHTMKAHAPFFMDSVGNHAIVLMDCWPAIYETTIRWARQYRISHVFLSASQVAKELRDLAPDIQWHWLPEGLPTDTYRPKPWEERSVDVLSFGRKHKLLHDQLERELSKRGVSYLFEPRPGEILFPSHEEFLDGLGNAKVSVCFPRNVTHPESSGHIETLTVRYLQSMASRCIIYGQSPKELVDLFGYDPVISVDWTNPAEQIKELTQTTSEPELVARNFETVYRHHTERQRAETLARTLNLDK